MALDAKFYQEIEGYILGYWLETGSQPSIEQVASRFSLTVEDIEPLVESYDDEETA